MTTTTAPAAHNIADRFATMAEGSLLIALDQIDGLCKNASTHDARVAMIRVRTALITEVSTRWPSSRTAVDALAPAPLDYAPLLRVAIDVA